MQPSNAATGSEHLNRVPDVTNDFWLVKVMAVTMGETAADYLAVNLGLGLSMTSAIVAAILAVVLVVQFSNRRYVPWTCWSAVVLISIGTLVVCSGDGRLQRSKWSASTWSQRPT
jgi:uncharacterized membrane-anchored protein